MVICNICTVLTTFVTVLIIAQHTRIIDGFLLARNRSYQTLSNLVIVTSKSNSYRNDDDHSLEYSNVKLSRRDVFQSTIRTIAVISSELVGVESVSAKEEEDLGYIPAIRPTAYRVDSTTPPTLIPVNSARKEKKVLNDLGLGFGTDKEVIKQDTLNLNNFMNKVVFGSIDYVSGFFSEDEESIGRSGPGYASFVCMGVPSATTSKDIDLASSLLSSIVEERGSKKATALGLAFCPMSVQSSLDMYSKTGLESDLKSAIKKSGVTDETVELYMPLLRYAKGESIELLAISPEYEDIKAARTDGLASVDIERRQSYVADPEGFVSTTKDPRYKLYTDRSLLKDFTPMNADDNIKSFFAERIFVHEAGATAVAKYSIERPESLVAIVAPTPDVRYLEGLNGRIPRVYSSLLRSKNIANKVTNDAVTTILLNPTALETLSASNYLRLEIGTGPETIDYQSKIADYLWFSNSPKVNLIHRMMNG